MTKIVDCDAIVTGACVLGVLATRLPIRHPSMEPSAVPPLDASMMQVFPDKLQVADPMATLIVPTVVMGVTVFVVVEVEMPWVTVVVVAIVDV